MILPFQTTFRNMDASAAVAERIQEEAAQLDKYFDRIASCRDWQCAAPASSARRFISHPH
jgi:hypothetical protein